MSLFSGIVRSQRHPYCKGGALVTRTLAAVVLLVLMPSGTAGSAPRPLSAAQLAGLKPTPAVARKIVARPSSTFSYTDDPLMSGMTVRRIHLTELRASINALRQSAGLADAPWTDATPTVIRAVHVLELRSALGEALIGFGRQVPTWNDSTLAAARIKTVHLQELRNATRWELGGTVASDTVWTAQGSPYIVTSDVAVTNGATLTIQPGTVVKFSPNTSLIAWGTARLIADGGSQRIVFTSLKDDSVGGDTNRDGGATKPAPGDWGVLGYGSGNQPAFGSLTNVRVSYGNQLRTLYSAPMLRDVTSTFMAGDGLYIDSPPSNYTVERMVLTNNERNLMLVNVPASTTIRNCLIREAKSLAVNVVRSAARLESNSIDSNGGGAAVVTDSASPLTLRYNSITNNRTPEGYARGVRVACCSATVDARENWWGSTTGPEVEGQSSSGGGGQVGTNVLYDPWLGKFLAEAFKAGDHPWTIKAGVGVDVATGNFFLVEKDISIPTIGFPLEIVRTYNSKIAGGMRSDFGDGWMWNYGTQIRNADPPHGVVWQREDGTETYFKRNPDDSFSSEEGIYERLVWDPAAATYRMTRKDQSVIVFASDGRLSAQIDASGNVTTIVRDGSGRVTQVTEPRRRTLSFEYAADGYIQKVTDPVGRTFVYQRNPNGAIASVVMRDQTGSTFAEANYYYGAGGRWEMIGLVDANGNRLEQEFEAVTQRVSTQRFNNNNPVRFAYGETGAFGFQFLPYSTGVSDSRGRVHVYRYTPSNKVTEHSFQHYLPDGSYQWLTESWSYVSYLTSAAVDLAGRMTQSTYDWNTGNLTRVVEPNGRTTRFEYDAFNNLAAKTDHLGRETRYEYDGNQRLVKTTDALSHITTRNYFSDGLLNWESDHRGGMTSYSYDENGYVVTSANSVGDTTRYTHDKVGRKTNEQNGAGERWSFTFDGRGNVLAASDPLGNTTEHRYDIAGRKTQMTDAEGHVTKYEYDYGKNAHWRTTDADGGVVELTRDDFAGNIVSVRDANLHSTTFGYDDLNRRTSEKDPLGREWRFEYAATNRLSRATDAMGRVTTYTYDSADQLTRIDYADGATATFGYDGVGNRTTLTDWTGTTSWTFDAMNRVTKVSKSGRDTTYAFDPVGNPTRLESESGKPVTYAYDLANRLQSVRDWQGRETSYTYDRAGRIATYALPNGVTAAHTYDGAGRLVQLTYARGLTSLATVHYVLDRTGARTSRRLNSAEETYGYDALYRLTSVNYASGRRTRFAYDAAGNRTSRTEAYPGSAPFTVNSTYDAADQLTQEASRTRSYTANGDLTDDGPSRSFYWNMQHLLSRVDDNGTATFTYDAEGRRVQQARGGIVTSYVVNTVPKISEVLIETSGATTIDFVYGHDLLYVINGAEVYFPHADGLGSTVAATNSAGQPTSTLEYEVFGSLMSGGRPAWFTRLFSGEENDGNLIYLRARYYEPATGRFLSRDPFPMDTSDTQSVNRYIYVKNNPINSTDPTGQFAVVPGSLLSKVLKQYPSGQRPSTSTTRFFGDIVRLPDYGTYALGVGLPPPLPPIGGSISMTFDAARQVYITTAAGAGRAPTILSLSAVSGWLDQPKPSPRELRDFFTGAGSNVSAGFLIGGGKSFSSSGRTATEIGVMTPQFGAAFGTTRLLWRY